MTLGGGVFEAWEIVLCGFSLAAVVYHAVFMSSMYMGKKWYPLYIALYALFGFAPTLVIILYAFIKMSND